MTTRGTLLSIALLILLGAGAYLALRPSDVVTTPPTDHALIRVTSPLPNTIISSPITVTGEARGNWYFEASFPVELLDGNGKVLALVPAQAQGEWMTENFVPFSVTLNFATPTTDIGTLVLHKDNPSDMRQFDDSISIPIRFR